MSRKAQSFLLSLIFILLFAACGTQAIPTPAPLAQLPSATPTSNLPPTLDISTAVPEVAPTRPTNTPRPTHTPTPVDAVISITFPRANEILTLGNEVEVGGLVEKDEEHTILVSLVTSNGRVLASVPGAYDDPSWTASFILPPQVSGLAYLRAHLLDAGGNVVAEHESPVLLRLNATPEGRYLELYRPEINDTAVGGYNIFFDGMVLRPVGNLVTISVWANDCQEQVAQEGFRLGSSSLPFYWQGFVVVPKDLVGPACAVAYFGEPGTEEWREVQIPIEVLPSDSINARGVTIGNPPPNKEIFAGDELVLYGTAQNVAYGPVLVSIIMENGRIVAQADTETDLWGYWETTILLPFDILGLAEITASAGEDDTFAETTTVVNVLPAPTPTP